VNPRPTLEALRKYYAASGHGADPARTSVDAVLAREVEYPNSTLDAKRIVNVSRTLRPGIRSALDVGSGHGFFSLEARRQGLSVTALESADFEFTCTQRIAGFDPVPIMFEDFVAAPGSFDLVIMSQVLEHAFDVNQWVSKAAGLMSRGGLLAIALPNFRSATRLVLRERDPLVSPPAHLNYFGPRSLRALCARHGLEVLSLGSLSRIPGDVVSKRVRATGATRIFVEGLTAGAFAVFRTLADPLHFGMMLGGYFGKGAADD
jgi:2-polyprenyl-3-methyl-5-hydroxy-6-metoxy-1,4-benzoquinol methylase